MDEWTRVKQLSACYITPQQSSTFCFSSSTLRPKNNVSTDIWHFVFTASNPAAMGFEVWEYHSKRGSWSENITLSMVRRVRTSHKLDREMSELLFLPALTTCKPWPGCQCSFGLFLFNSLWTDATSQIGKFEVAGLKNQLLFSFLFLVRVYSDDKLGYC